MIRTKTRAERIAVIRERISPKISTGLAEMLPSLTFDQQIQAILTEKPELLGDAIWRIGNLYWCGTDDIECPVARFVPKDPQCLLLYDTFVDGWNRHCVLKARRIGFSTLICIMGADHVFFNKDSQFNMVSLNEAKAQELLEGKIRFAYDNLPDFVRKFCKINAPTSSNKSELMFSNNWGMRSKDSLRGGTSHVLHISEWGISAFENKKKSHEIKTGSLPTARHRNSLVFLESTVRGGEQGDYWNMWTQAMAVTEETRNQFSYNPFFCPWFWDPINVMDVPSPDVIRLATRDYIKDVQKYWKERGWAPEDYEIDDEQAYWWQCEQATQGADMNQEYPSTPEEAFMSPVDGAVYADRLVHLGREGQIFNFRHNEALPVYAIIDHGFTDATAVWLVQQDGTRLDFIWYFEDRQQVEQYFVNKVLAAGFTPVRWVLPWDCWQWAEGKRLNPNCPAARYMRAGAQGCYELKRGTKRRRVEFGKALLNRARFIKNTTEVGRLSMMNYSWPVDKPEPVHDKNSHGADGYGYTAEAEALGVFKGNRNISTGPMDRSAPRQKKKRTPYRYGKC